VRFDGLDLETNELLKAERQVRILLGSAPVDHAFGRNRPLVSQRHAVGTECDDIGIKHQTVTELRRHHLVQLVRRDRVVGHVEEAAVAGKMHTLPLPARRYERLQPFHHPWRHVRVVERPRMVTAKRWPAFDDANIQFGTRFHQPPSDQRVGKAPADEDDIAAAGSATIPCHVGRTSRRPGIWRYYAVDTHVLLLSLTAITVVRIVFLSDLI